MATLENPGDRPVVTTMSLTDAFRVRIGSIFKEVALSSLKLILAGGTPSIAAGAGAGTGASVTLDANATDMSGCVTIVTGTTPTGANADIFTVTFSTPFATTPHVMFSPGNENAAALGGTQRSFIDAASLSTSSFKMISATSAIVASRTYIFFYQVSL
jgi:hypothetical protein